MLPTVLRTAGPPGGNVRRVAAGIQVQGQRYARLTTRAARPSNAPEKTQVLRPSIASRPLLYGALRPAPCCPMSTKPPLQPNKIDKEFEKQVREKKLETRPDEVTSSSSVRQVIEQSQAPPEATQDVLAGIKGDLNTIKDTFALKSVPREAFGLGLAGTLPYLATSLSTVYLSWTLNSVWPTTSNLVNSFLLSHDSATHWLHILEPIQVGYGAVIISFLGAIHWGLEFAEKQASSQRTRFRYGLGVLAPAVAWPTIFMPTEWALVTQFAAFVSMYFADSRATTRGWVPAWYGTYRFVLTAIVGSAIFISLIGRAKVGEGHTRLSTAELRERINPTTAAKNRDWAKEEEKEKLRIQEEKKKEEKKRKQAEKKAKEETEKKESAEKKSSGNPEDKGKPSQEEEGE